MDTLPPLASKWGFLVTNISYSRLSSCCSAAQISIRNKGLGAGGLGEAGLGLGEGGVGLGEAGLCLGEGVGY